MAVARDQAARILRSEPETADGARDDSAAPAETLRSHVAEETKRRPPETPAAPKPPPRAPEPASVFADKLKGALGTDVTGHNS